jgi:hypothetical protein
METYVNPAATSLTYIPMGTEANKLNIMVRAPRRKLGKAAVLFLANISVD